MPRKLHAMFGGDIIVIWTPPTTQNVALRPLNSKEDQRTCLYLIVYDRILYTSVYVAYIYITVSRMCGAKRADWRLAS